jgi:hypothetical protein
MRKALIGLTAAAALAAGTVTVSTPANATPAWVVPALIVTAVGGVLVGAAIANANNTTVVAGHGITPSGPCDIQTRVTPDGTPYQVQICP